MVYFLFKKARQIFFFNTTYSMVYFVFINAKLIFYFNTTYSMVNLYVYKIKAKILL